MQLLLHDRYLRARPAGGLIIAARMELTRALKIGEREVVAVVGAGGKTTAVFRLCLEASAIGRRAVASGTARFSEPDGLERLPAVIEKDEDRLVNEVARRLQSTSALIAAAGRFSKDRYSPITFGAAGRLAREPSLGLLALEADGARMRSFKAPAEHEPAIPTCATLVVAVVGADAFGQPLDEGHVHRPERVMELASAEHGATITPALVAAVLADRQGGRKHVPERARFAVLINKVTPERLKTSRECAHLLRQQGVDIIALANVRDPLPVIEASGADPW
jgi:probable selenium-dependent hydroxylase accessory protein YqeC